jgi:hypothetical protein
MIGFFRCMVNTIKKLKVATMNLLLLSALQTKRLLAFHLMVGIEGINSLISQITMILSCNSYSVAQVFKVRVSICEFDIH